MWWPLDDAKEVTVFLMGQAGNANSLTARSYEGRFGARINKEGLKRVIGANSLDIDKMGKVFTQQAVEKVSFLFTHLKKAYK
jgi:hypothetical protein